MLTPDKILQTNRAALISSIESSIAYSSRLAWMTTRTKRGPAFAPEEPDIIAMLVLQGARQIGQTLQLFLAPHGFRVSTTSVFCHGRPRVRHTSGACELGDVLFAHIHSPSTGPTTRRALLLQAKKSSEMTHVVPHSEYHQLKLYLGWPRFTYVGSGRLNGLSRDVMPKQRHLGAQYLLIDPRPPEDPSSGISGMSGTFCMGVAATDYSLHISNALSSELVDLMMARSGREFGEHAATASDGWTTVIWDLLEYAAMKTFSRKRQLAISGKSRLNGPNLFARLDGTSRSWKSDTNFRPDTFSRFHNENGDNPPDGPNDLPEGGVSVILIETSDGDDKRRGQG